MQRPPRPIPARVRILAAILAVACIGLAIVGSVTFLVQRDRVLTEVDERLDSQVEQLLLVADPTSADVAAGEEGTATASPSLDKTDYASVEEYLEAVVAQLTPGRHEASAAIVDGVARFRPGTHSDFEISERPGPPRPSDRRDQRGRDAARHRRHRRTGPSATSGSR